MFCEHVLVTKFVLMRKILGRKLCVSILILNCYIDIYIYTILVLFLSSHSNALQLLTLWVTLAFHRDGLGSLPSSGELALLSHG